MIYKKPGLPKNNDFVLSTVKNILHHSVFVSLDEYQNLEGLIHISEIAPGRIRNIRDYVKPDKKIVCKVLKINTQTKQIDLSLRRVSINAMKIKIDEVRQEERAEKLLESAGKALNMDLEKMYGEAGIKIIDEFGSLQECFNKIVNEKEDVLKKIGINERIANSINKLVKEKIKPPKAVVKLVLDLKSYAPNGLEIIKTLLSNINSFKKKVNDIKVSYISAPRYQLEITTFDIRNSESIAEGIAEEIIEQGKKANIIGKWLKAY